LQTEIAVEEIASWRGLERSRKQRQPVLAPGSTRSSPRWRTWSRPVR